MRGRTGEGVLASCGVMVNFSWSAIILMGIEQGRKWLGL